MPVNPVVDMPSTDTELCDIGGCPHAWAWECEERRHGPRALRLCEDHATRWLEGKEQLDAELVEVTCAAKEAAAREDLRAVTARLERLGDRIAAGAAVAEGRKRTRPGTAKALAAVGRGNDKRRRARRGIS